MLKKKKAKKPSWKELLANDLYKAWVTSTIPTDSIKATWVLRK